VEAALLWTAAGYRFSLIKRDEDNGLRLLDLNGDGADDVIFSNAERYRLALMVRA
jgi:hypothetical protein